MMACSGPPEVETPPPPARPDIVLVLIDTLRVDHLPTWGYPKDTAPWLSAVADEGLVFEHAWSTSSWTAPSTASVFTGLYPPQHGVILGMQMTETQGAGTVELNTIPNDIATLPELMKAAGYSTHGVASNINIGDDIGFSRGFDRFVYSPGSPASELAREVAGWKEELDAGPSFLYLHLNDVHSPYEARSPWYEEPESESERMVAAYDSEIAYVDQQLSRLHEHLGWDDALLLVVTDHGEEFGDHGRYGHLFQLYRELNQVAIVAHGPGIEPGRVRAHASLIDILPTLAATAGFEPQGEGIALGPELEDRRLFAHRHRVLAGQPEEIWAVIEGDQRLITGPGRPELYALDDAREQRDLSFERADEVARLQAELEGFRSGLTLRSEAVSTELDAQELEMLKSLGYVH